MTSGFTCLWFDNTLTHQESWPGLAKVTPTAHNRWHWTLNTCSNSQVSDTSETQANNHFLHPALGLNVSLNGILELLANLTDFNNLTSISRNARGSSLQRGSLSVYLKHSLGTWYDSNVLILSFITYHTPMFVVIVTYINVTIQLRYTFALLVWKKHMLSFLPF